MMLHAAELPEGVAEGPIRPKTWVADVWFARNDAPPAFWSKDAATVVESTTDEPETDDRPVKVDTSLHPVTKTSGVVVPSLTRMRRTTSSEAFVAKKNQVATSPGVALEGVPSRDTLSVPPGTGEKVHPPDPRNLVLGWVIPAAIPIPSAATTVHGPPDAPRP